jgi:hypothetical protein
VPILPLPLPFFLGTVQFRALSVRKEDIKLLLLLGEESRVSAHNFVDVVSREKMDEKDL